MYQFYQAAPRWRSPANLDTTLGFLGHVLADRQVHWNYFPGGTWRWALHPVKESWADYIVYINALGGSFDLRGRATALPPLLVRGEPALISEAQREFIRRGYGVGPGQEGLATAQSEAEVANLLVAYIAELGVYRERISVAGFVRYMLVAQSLGWSISDLETVYDNTLKSLQSTYAGYR